VRAWYADHVSNLRFIVSVSLTFALGCASVAATSPHPEPAPAQQSVALNLRLASTHWPPFTDEEGRPRIAIDLVTRALSRAGYASSTEIVPDDTLDEALRSGNFAGSGAMWESAERRAELVYSKPYFENKLVLVTKTGRSVDIASLAALQGKRLGIVEGYAYGEVLEEGDKAVLVRAGSTEENLRALLHDEVDYVLADDLVIHHMLEHYPGQLKGKLTIGQKPLVRRSLHLAISKQRPDAQAIIDAFNAALGGMLRDGSYNELLEVQWIGTDIDGDGRLELVAAEGRVGQAPPAHVYNVLIPVPSAQGGAVRDTDPDPHFVVKGVSYDSWSAVPDEHKTRTDELPAKPRTLRVEVFEF
jgi:polar amino acid transport system substrate-binding protein